MNSIILCTDAYGGRGGIALYNRNFIRAVSSHQQIDKVNVFPRKIYYSMEKVPENVVNNIFASKNKFTYIISIFLHCFKRQNVKVIFCTHIHLLPAAIFLAFRYRCEVRLLVYGRDAWQETRSKISNFFARRLKTFISMRHFTARKLIDWAQLDREISYYHLPNCIDLNAFSIKEPDISLIKKYKLENKKVIITAGRLDKGDDLRKGFDEVIEALPLIKEKVNNIAYLIIGDGEDTKRLEKKVSDLKLNDVVIFTGYIKEKDKADYFRLGDIFAMPGSNPNFDRYPFRFVFLEALACGLKVIGSELTDQWEIDDPDSKLIIQVNPKDKSDIANAITKELNSNIKTIDPRLKNFSYESYRNHIHFIIDNLGQNNGY